MLASQKREQRDRLSSWLYELPGIIIGDTDEEVMREALAESRCECSLEDFTKLMFDAGYKPEQRRNPDTGDYYYILALPEHQLDGGGGKVAQYRNTHSKKTHIG